VKGPSHGWLPSFPLLFPPVLLLVSPAFTFHSHFLIFFSRTFCVPFPFHTHHEPAPKSSLGLGKRCKLPSSVRSRLPSATAFLIHFEPRKYVLWQLITPSHLADVLLESGREGPWPTLDPSYIRQCVQ